MGISRNNEPELIRLTAIDFFTGAILIDNLVAPDVPLAHYNTHYSGVSARHMATAIRNRTAIHGRDRARMGLLEFVGPETVVVVHGGSGDFRALRWIHPLIVDPEILEGYAGPNVVPGEKSLKNLCKVKLGIDVQVRDAANGKLGHDSVEDALATRELAIQWLQSIPDGHGRMGRKKIRVK
jgi:RNA exonuclease 1